MQPQNNPMVQGNPDDKSQPLNPATYLPLLPEQSNQNPPQFQSYQNPQAIQYQNQNINMMNIQQIGPYNQIYVAPGTQPNKLIIPFRHGIVLFFIYLFISSLVIVNLMENKYVIFMVIFFAFEFVLYIAYEKSSLEIIKDDFQKKLNIKIKNYFSCTRKILEFDLENVFLNVVSYEGSDVLVVLNNYKKINGMDSYKDEINDQPAKIFYHFRNIDVSEFNGVSGLNNILNNFLGFQGNKENPLNFNIYSYMHKTQNTNQNVLSQNIIIKYLKINEQFFTYFSKNPIAQTKFDGVLIKIVSGLFHTAVLINYLYYYFYLRGEKSILDKDENILIAFAIGYVGFTLFGACVCGCIKFSYDFLRIDLIFSNDYNKLFIGVSKNNDLYLYTSRDELVLNTVERFILRKHENNNNTFFLDVFKKGNNMTDTICDIEDSQTELEGLLYLLNERIINDNNGNMNMNNNMNNNINTMNNNNINEYPMQSTL